MDVRYVSEDLGSPEVTLEIAGCDVPKVAIDGGSGVNIMIEDLAFKLGYTTVEPTVHTIRLADGAKVIPTGTLSNVATNIAGTLFALNYLVIRPRRPSTFPILIGRPWLYQEKVIEDWGKWEFRFGKPEVAISWDNSEYQGETTAENEEYDSNTS